MRGPVKLSSAFVAVVAALVLAPVPARAQGQPCRYQSSEYSDGALSCQRGEQVQCLNGEWVSQGRTCVEESGSASGGMNMESGAEEPLATDSFMPGDTQVAPESPEDAP